MTISNEAVEVAAKTAYEFQYSSLEGRWEFANPRVQGDFRNELRAALEAAAPIIRAGALEDAAEERSTRSDTYFQAMQNMAESREYELSDIVRYGAYSAEAKSTATWLRARAAAERGRE